MTNKLSKNALLYVYISTHFKEMFRVALLMKNKRSYVPIINFMTPYDGWERDVHLCELEGIKTIFYFEHTNELLKPNKSKFKNYLTGSNNGIKSLLLFVPKSILKGLFLILGWIINLVSMLVNSLFCIAKFIINFIISIKNKIKTGFNQALNCAKGFYKSASESFKISTKKIIDKTLIKIDIFFNSLIYRIKCIFHPLIRFILPIFGRHFWARSLLICFRIIWNKCPYFLPPISASAYSLYNRAPKILEEHEIQLMVFPEHNLFYFTQILVFLGRKLNIHSIIVPFTIANTIEWSEAFYNEPSRSFKSAYNRICAYAFPNWVNIYKNKQLLLPIDLVLLHEMLAISPSKPWLLNSGDIDLLASESDAMSQYYIDSGIEKKFLRVTGSLYNDELYSKIIQLDENRVKLYQSLGIKSNKPLMLCALPPNQCFGRLDHIDFENYEEIIRFFVGELTQYAESYNIVINLHPRIKSETVTFLSEYPVKIYKGDIVDVVPLSSIYVASCSATIRMAITCGIPVINYDLYKYHYNDYTHLNGVLTVFDRKDYSSTIHRMVTDTDYFNSIKNQQQLQSNNWGVLDGKSGENLIHEINKLFVERKEVVEA